MIKSRYPELYKEIDNIEADTFKEKCYIYNFGKNNICSVSGKETKFISYKCGYQTYYGNKEATIGIKDKRYDSIRKAFLKKYGVEHYSQTQEYRNRRKELHNSGHYDYVEINKKVKNTKLEKYGNSNYVNIEKNKQTKLEKYGDENYNNREKNKQTCLEKYGVSNYSKTEKSRKELSRRCKEGLQGFGGKKYKQFLKNKGIENISQCPNVSLKKSNKKLKESYDNIIKLAKNKNIELQFKLNDYVGQYKGDLGWIEYEFKCLKCNNVFLKSINNLSEFGCLKCEPKPFKRSKPQYELQQYIESIYDGKVLSNKKSFIPPYEIDICIPDKKICIEFDGVFYHSEVNGQVDRNYHLMKTKLVDDIDMRLIHIFDNEWYLKKDIVKSFIYNLLNGYKYRIFARKCIIKEISSIECNKFLNINHLQGSDNSSIRLGLYYENELVSVMTFGKTRFNKEIE
jgi:hypothetical protein